MVYQRDPGNNNVNRHITKLTNTNMDINNEQLASQLVNDMNNQFPLSIPVSHPINQFSTSIPSSHPNSQFPTLIEPPKNSTSENMYEFQNSKKQKMSSDIDHHLMLINKPVSLMSLGSHNFDLPIDMEYNGYNFDSFNNISIPQYFGGSSFNEYSQPNVGSTYVFSDKMNVISPLDVKQADPKFVTYSENASSFISTSAFDVRKVPPDSGWDATSRSSTINSYQQQSFNQGQYGSSIGEKEVGHQRGFPTSVNDVKSLYSSQSSLQPHFQYNSEDSSVMSSKFKFQTSTSGTYMQPQAQMSAAHQPNQQARQLPLGLNGRLKDQSTFKIPQANSWKPVQSQPHVAEESSDLNNDGLSDMLHKYYKQIDFQLPPLEDVSVVKTTPLSMVSVPEVNNTITENVQGTNEQISKCPEGNISTTTKDEYKEPPEFCFEEKNSKAKEESIQVGLKVACAFNTVSDDYQDVSSVDLDMTLESENTKTSSTSFNDYNSGLGSGIIKTPSVSANHMVSESENTKTQIASGNIKRPSASLVDSLTASQIKEHLSSFTQKSENMAHSIKESPCQLCCVDSLLLMPAPIYCLFCEQRIKQNAVYYRSTDKKNKNTDKNKNTEENKHTEENKNTEETKKTENCICKNCFQAYRGSTIAIPGGSILKENFERTKNDEEIEDMWVLCDSCEKWQHRICGLYNDKIDKEKAAYICPKCRLTEIEEGKWVPLPQTVLGAKDLPRTNLSDHIEQRLLTRMKQEREETAKFQGTELEKVAEAEGLVVRVVSSIDKELEVKQEFRDIFGGKDYPKKLKYRSKFIILFQRLEGVNVCVFGMYVQEYGSECDGPNNRCGYISYLDSIKYFQPERKTASGESLRTFVYHEILIGYLEYCKKRGFSTCYIWSCPVIKGQDYIFYCRPKTQKTPKEDKLRHWYKSMLKKAQKEGIVVDQNNLYNQFFVPPKEETIKITAARLPYFDGAYWLGAAETISKNLDKEENSGKLCSKLPNKRILMAMGQDNPTKDVVVMQQLGDEILKNKENLMIVHLQHMCTCCQEAILSGSRWFCNQCEKFQLCPRCFDSGKLLSRKKMHTCHSGKINRLSEDVLRDLPHDTKDKDGILINNFFETRDDFLNKCEKSQYQFNTLSHAKYSSMMILYHFTHKLVIQRICTLCNNHVVIDQCHHRDTFPNPYICGSCFESKGETSHEHELIHPLIKNAPKTENEEEPQKQKVTPINEAPDALVHVSLCRKIGCTYPDCLTIKRLLQHACKCSVRVRNGCNTCEQAWLVLMEHGQNCTDSNCEVYRCMWIKKALARNDSFCIKLQNKYNPPTS